MIFIVNKIFTKKGIIKKMLTVLEHTKCKNILKFTLYFLIVFLSFLFMIINSLLIGIFYLKERSIPNFIFLFIAFFSFFINSIIQGFMITIGIFYLLKNKTNIFETENQQNNIDIENHFVQQ